MRWPRLSQRAKNRLAALASFIVIVPMIALGGQVWNWLHGVWAEHWLRRDAKPVPAVVTGVGAKRVLDYGYTVDGREYSGRGSRDWQEDRDYPIGVGGKMTALVSASHPWLSCLDLSRSAWMGLPIVLAILVFEFFLLAVLVDGILRLLFGIQIHTGQPEDSVVVMMFAGALILCLALAALALGKRRWRQSKLSFRVGRSDSFE